MAEAPLGVAVDALCGAASGTLCAERVNRRNATGRDLLETGAGTISLARPG